VLRSMFMGTMKPLSDHDPVAVEFDYAVVASCGNPIADSGDFRNEGSGRTVVAGDALFVLRSAVGSAPCALCTCDVNASASVSATDALVVLRFAVGQNVALECPPCEGTALSTTSMSTTTTTATTKTLY
jgi:hypothetical protein